MSKNIFSIEQNGHVYRVVPVEGSDKWYTVTKDGQTTKRIAYDELFLDGEVIDIENWFNIA
jgi:hypothetical protein